MSTSSLPSTASTKPFSWVPTLYFAEGIPYTVVTVVSVMMLKKLGMDNAALSFWTSWLMLPWIFKPLWAPLIDLRSTKRRWILALQFGMAAIFALAAFAMPLACATKAILWLFLALAFFSATHDAAADGFYMIAIDSHAQAAYSGIRSTFYRAAMIIAQGALVMLAGFVEAHSSTRTAWTAYLALAAAIFAALGLYHFFMLPKPEAGK